MLNRLPIRQYEILQYGSDRLRVAPWRSDSSVAEIIGTTNSTPLRVASIQNAMRLLELAGYRCVMTNALSETERRSFLQAGFEVYETLHLLTHTLIDVPKPRRGQTKRGFTRDYNAILEVDTAAFEPFWRLDERGLVDAISATPRTRVRIAPGKHVCGYAITGLSGFRGYLQRLAVHPDYQGSGIGSSLVIDSLYWLKRHRCQIAMVNTQESNEGALRLYQSHGFINQPSGLAVLRYSFEHHI